MKRKQRQFFSNGICLWEGRWTRTETLPSRGTLPTRRHFKSTTPPAGWIVEYPNAHHLKGELGSYEGNKNFFTAVSQIHLLCAASFLVDFHAVFSLTFATPLSVAFSIYRQDLSYGTDKQTRSGGCPKDNSLLGAELTSSAEAAPSCGELK